MLVSTQLSDNRRLMLETQVQQDLRASADIITRELRRAGHWAKARDGVWYAGNAAAVRDQPLCRDRQGGRHARFADGEASSAVLLSYSRSGDEADETGAIEPASSWVSGWTNGVIQTRLGDAGWQALTDGNTLNVTEFQSDHEPAADPAGVPQALPGPAGRLPPDAGSARLCES